MSTQGGPWTSHGHSIDGVTVAGDGRPPVARCGGPGMCPQCSQEEARIRADLKAQASAVANRKNQGRVLRFTVPVNDRPHLIGGGRVLMVAARNVGEVDVWTRETLPPEWPEGPDCRTRWVQAFATGQPLPVGAGEHVGSTLDLGGALVWHVFAVPQP